MGMGDELETPKFTSETRTHRAHTLPPQFGSTRQNHTETVGLPLVKLECGRAKRSQRSEVEALEQGLAAELVQRGFKKYISQEFLYGRSMGVISWG